MLTTVGIFITQFGSAIVYVLLSAELLEGLVGKDVVSYCIWILVVAGVLLPLSYLGSPKDFW